MTKLMFITHPGVVIDPQTPIDQWRLSEDGLEDAQRLCQKIWWKGVDCIYSSSEPKASSVALIVSARCGIPLTADFKQECLGEIRNRTFIEQSRFHEAVAAWYANPAGHPNGWESVHDAEKRILACVREIMTANDGKTVAILGHGGTGTLLLCAIQRVVPTLANDPLTTGCVAVIDWGEQRLISGWEKY